MLEHLGDSLVDDVLGLIGVGEHPRHQLACLMSVEEAQGQLLQLAVKLVPHVADDALAHLNPERVGGIEENVLQQQSHHHHQHHVA